MYMHMIWFAYLLVNRNLVFAIQEIGGTNLNPKPSPIPITESYSNMMDVSECTLYGV